MSSTNNRALPTHNLPASLSTFVGRTQEIARVKALLAEHRLLSLTGTGGCGKTRLALRVASDLQEDFRDGIWLTEFASLADEELVARAVASTLGLREQAERPIAEALTNHLRAHNALLILDNCEHLVEAIAQLSAALLVSCPAIRILTTSREPLGIPGEMVMVVAPLSLPDPQPWRGPGSEQAALTVYQQSEAIQLFVARAAAASPEFRLNEENGAWVAGICRRLDGIPLAIELAAARLRAFSVQQIAERLDDRFQLLTSRLRTAPLRHQTLEAAMDWSYQLLPDAEQKIFRRLSVFALEWTLEAAEAVCSDGDISTQEVMDGLANLVEKSLVIADSALASRRFRFLETIRQYAHQKIAAAGELDAARDRHLEYFLRWAEKNAAHLEGPEQSSWLERFAREHDNIRAALDWSLTNPASVEKGVRLAAACGYFWRLHGDFREGRERLSTLLRQPCAQEQTSARAWALLWEANLAYVQSDYPAVRALADEGLSIFRQLGSEGRPGAAHALDLLGELATEVGEYQKAPALLEEALEIYRALDHKRGIAIMLMQLGWAAMRVGDYPRAESLLQECLPLLKQLDESSMLGFAMAGLGELALRQGRLPQAERLLEDSLKLRRSLGERWGTAAVLGSLGWAALLQRDFHRMREMLGESLNLRVDIGDQGGVAWCFEKLAEGLLLEAATFPAPQRSQASHRAIRIFAAAAALRASLHSIIDPVDQPEHDRTLRELHDVIGAVEYDAAWEQGQSLPILEIADLALAPAIEPLDAASLSDAQAAKAKFRGLTSQERRTAVLIAQGKTNREIAEAMSVQVKTVETYVTRMLTKLNFDSRVQVATWALKAGLMEPNQDDP